MEERKALEMLPLDKENFESWVDETLSVKLTDEEWEKVADELDYRVANFVDSILYELALTFRKKD
jgi:hypothetical protein